MGDSCNYAQGPVRFEARGEELAGTPASLASAKRLPKYGQTPAAHLGACLNKSAWGSISLRKQLTVSGGFVIATATGLFFSCLAPRISRKTLAMELSEPSKP